jgi:hypothetical protein
MWPFPSKPKPHIPGGVIGAAELRDVVGFLSYMGKDRYGVMNSAALVSIAREARDNLCSRYDITRWHESATCTLFANEFVSVANGRYFGASFQDQVTAPAAAAGVIWFQPDNSTLRHAIGIAYTEVGERTIDPQRPDVLRPLSASERASISLRLFL